MNRIRQWENSKTFCVSPLLVHEANLTQVTIALEKSLSNFIDRTVPALYHYFSSAKDLDFGTCLTVEAELST